MWILDGLKKLQTSPKEAIITRMGSYSFEELWKYSEYLSWDIEELEKKTPVVIYGDKQLDVFPVMLAALKTGRAYVPVDISYPVDRLRKIMNIVDASVLYNFSELKIDAFCPVRDYDYLHQKLYTNPHKEKYPEENWVKEDDDCYILFTSGSTGEPKGVPISKSNILNFTCFSILELAGNEKSVVVNMALSFDASVPIIYHYLPAGLTLICADKELTGNTSELINYYKNYSISIWCSTPSLLDMCLDRKNFNHNVFSELNAFFIGGEIFSKSTAVRALSAFPEAKINNVYGPTEATVEFVACSITQEMINKDNHIPIGKVMDEAEYHIINESGNECQSGEMGELIVISKSVSRGYFNNPEKTKEVFFRSEDGRMGYRTGDLVYEKDGLLYFAGRKDFQIKLNGYRIEIEDIAENIAKIPFIYKSAVLPHMDDEGKVDYIVGIVVLDPDYPGKNKLKNTIEIKRQLRELIPVYMVPQKILFIDEMPLNVNGKIDRKALELMV